MRLDSGLTSIIMSMMGGTFAKLSMKPPVPHPANKPSGKIALRCSRTFGLVLGIVARPVSTVNPPFIHIRYVSLAMLGPPW
jgi:hypothetical protein